MDKDKYAFRQRVKQENSAPLVEYEPGIYYDHSSYTPIQPMEFWKPITALSTPNVYPGYWVSTLGRIWDSRRGILVPQYLDNNSYLRVTLDSTADKPVWNWVHRIVLVEFRGYDPDPRMVVVDHESPFKRNNSVYNLRWTSYVGNLEYARNLGVSGNVGEEVCTAILTEQQVHQVCKMMQDGVDRHHIYAYMRECGITYPDTTFDAIYKRRTWQHISQDYNFKDYKMRESNFTDEQIHYICQQLEANPDIKFADILIGLGIDMYTVEDRVRRKLSTAISHIKNGREHTEISCHYNIKPAPRKHMISEEQAHQICKMMQDHKENDEIARTLGLFTESDDSSRRNAIFSLLNRIRYKQAYTSISKNYDIL
ncbi:hypothetical protein [uncultured Duncaniella sp.]|uniref:hypothetical protein n=1 Tax=uncultured Duncaniella sp. TaxID=2768039 RepID=UPI00262426EF|nr:hypothetical protein [uncultured Duncaniella sp.]